MGISESRKLKFLYKKKSGRQLLDGLIFYELKIYYFLIPNSLMIARYLSISTLIR